jgi:hypothetical protein
MESIYVAPECAVYEEVDTSTTEKECTCSC